MTRQVTDQLYIELDYFTPEEYFVYTAEAVAAPSSNFSVTASVDVITPAIEASATLNSQFAQSADAGTVKQTTVTAASVITQNTIAGKIVEADIDCGALFTPTVTADAQLAGDALLESITNLLATVSKFVGNASTLNNIINLSLQSDRIRDNSSALSALFEEAADAARFRGVDASLAASSSLSIDADVTRDAITLQAGAFTLSADALNIQEAEADLQSSTALSATAISFVSRTRRNVVVDDYTVESDFATGIKKFGSASYKVYEPNLVSSSLDTILFDGSNFKIINDDSPYTTLTSSDGETWTSATATFPTNPGSGIDAYYYNGVYVHRGFRSSDNTWLTFTSSNSTTWNSLGNNVYLYLPAANSWYRLALNSTSWTISRTPTFTGGNATWNSVTTGGSGSGYTSNSVRDARGAVGNNDAAFAINASGNILIHQYNSLANWSTTATITGESVKEFFYGNSEWVLQTQSGKIYTSTDLATWTLQNTITTTGRLSYAGSYYWYLTDNNGLYKGTTLSGLTPNADRHFNYFDNVSQTSKIFYGNGIYLAADTKNKILTSIDGETWNIVNNFYSSTAPALEVNNIDNNELLSNYGSIDMWFYRNDSQQGILDHLNNTNYNLFFRPNTLASTGVAEYAVRTTTGGVAFSGFDTNTPVDSWNHIRLVRSGSNASIYLNGTRIVNTSDANLVQNNYGFALGNFIGGTEYAYFDEFYVTTTVLNDPADTTITVPTQPWKADATTLALIHFDGTFADDTTVVADANINMVSTATIVAVPNFTVDGITIHQSSGTLTANVGVVYENTATLNSEFTQTAEGEEVPIEFAADVSSLFTLGADITVIPSFNETFAAEFAVSADVTRIQEGVISTDAIFSELAAIAKIGQGLVTLESYINLAASADKTAGISADLNANATVNASVYRTQEGVATIQSQFTENVDAAKNVDVNTTATATATVDAVAIKAHGGAATLQSEFAVTADASGGFVGVDAALATSTALAADNIRVRFVETTANVVASATVVADRFAEFDANLPASANLNIEYTRIKDASIATDSVFSELAAVAKTGAGLVTMETAATLSVTGTVTTGNVVVMEAYADMAATALGIKGFDSALSSACTMTVQGFAGIVGSANLQGEFTLAVDADVTGEGVSVQSSVATLITVAVDRIRSADALITSSAITSAAVGAIRPATATTNAEFSSDINAGALLDVSIDLGALFTPTLTYRVLHTNQYVYTIPREIRIYSIRKESRSRTIERENRNYTIRG